MQYRERCYPREGEGYSRPRQKFTPTIGLRPWAGVNFWRRTGVPTPSFWQVKEVAHYECKLYVG